MLNRILVVLLVSALAPVARAQTIVVQGPGVLTGDASMPPRDPNAPRKTGTAVLRGRVVASDSGQPLRKAQVRVSSPELRENRLATTDANGKYEFKELPAGRYNLSVSKGSYVSLQFGQTRPFEPGKPLEIQDAQTIEKVDFSLPRGSVVTGRIVDEFGEPATDVMVTLQRYQNMSGRRRLVPSGRPSTTNDIGEFRLFAIPPGQYYLSASMRNAQMSPFDSSDDRSGYAPTYFPGTPNVAEAQRVTVGVGQTITDLAMALIPTKLARVSGSAVDSRGRAMSGMVMALPRGADMIGSMMMQPGQIRPDGTFQINGVAAGTYTLQANFGNSGPDSESASVDVTVNGEDVNDVHLVGAKPSAVTGRLVVDPAAAQTLRPSTMRVGMTPVQTDGIVFNTSGPAMVNDDLTFEAKARPGQMRLQVNPLPAGWGIRAVRYRATDVTDSGLDIRPNEDVGDVEIELTNRMPEVSGQVTNARGAIVKDYTVVVFPEDRERWTNNPRYVRSGRPDQDGRYKITSLPPGSYLIVALDQVEQGEWMDPDFLERMRPKASAFGIAEGETKSFDLKLNSAS